MKNELLAPNGKPSNLNAEQYKLVRSKAFMGWFGEWINDPANASKVVDENGEPLVVYHRAKSKFHEFNQGSGLIGWLGRGFYFSPDKNEFKEYGRSVLACFLNVKKLFTVKGESPSDVITEVNSIDKNNNSGFTDVSITLKENGFNGVLFKHWDRGVIINCFESNQVKLADGTNTTFDSNSDDIRFEQGGRTIAQTPAPKKDRIYGSDYNKISSSKDLSSAKLIKFDAKTLSAIKNKVAIHNEENPDKKINLASAKAIVRRGMGAYSKSHRPTITNSMPNSRVAWGLARLNAFTYKIINGKSKSGRYSQDDDLIEELGFKVANYKNGGEMKKDIRCINCGWEWNRKDSELWDMYVCHKCGFDNTTFYTSIPVNTYGKGGEIKTKNPNYLKMFLGK
jgi:hypothetical protein